MYVAADKWINDGGHRQIVDTDNKLAFLTDPLNAP